MLVMQLATNKPSMPLINKICFASSLKKTLEFNYKNNFIKSNVFDRFKFFKITV